MATGTYKSGVAIIVTYQAVACATGKTVTMDVYDEAHAKDNDKCVAEMTEIGSTGRYYATFTPDAEGEWIILMENTTDGNGKVVKAFAVAGNDLDSVGDDVAAIKAVTDVESGVKAAVDALNNVSTAEVNAEVDTALGDYDAPTKAELDSGLAALNDVSEAEVNAQVDSALADYDAPTKAEMDAGFAAVAAPAMVG